MDLSLLRSALTVIGLMLFIALVVWTWLPARRESFERAARAPLEGEPEVHDE